MFQKIDENSGLSDNKVQCIYRGHNGFMWIGTASGLNLLDGSGITVFKNSPDDTNSIDNNYITAIASDSSGILWIGTRMGLNSFDPALRRFTRISIPEKPSTKNNFIASIAIDHNNNILFAGSSGLFFYNRKSKRVSKIEVPGDYNKKILNNYVSQIAFDKQGLLWLTTYNGLWSYNENSHQFIHKISAQNDPDFPGLFTCFIFDHSGNLWIGTWNSGVKKFDPRSGKIITYSGKEVIAAISSMAEIEQRDSTWLIWINGNSLAFDENNNTFRSYKGFLKSNTNTQATFMYVSDKNMLWAGANSGLYFFDFYRKFFKYRHFKQPVTNQGIPILEVNNEILMGGDDKYFLRAYNENLEETDNFRNLALPSKISCLSLRKAGNNTIKCGTSSSGVADINLTTHAISFHRLPSNPNHSGTIDFITTLQMDKKQNWWLFPWRNGIWITDSSYKDTRQLINNLTTEYNLPKALVISDAFEDKNGNMWFSDFDEGILFYNRQKKQFSKPFAKYIGEKATVWQLLYYHNKGYSFTGSTLLTWNTDSMNLQKINLSSQIDKKVTSIGFDSTGHLWIASLDGLLSYDIKTKTFRHFTTADGLLNNEMDGTLYCLSDGTMIFACRDFISAFQPKKILQSIDNIPKLQLTEMEVNGSPKPLSISGKTDYNYTENNFIFKWAVTDYTNPLNNHYYYQLKGIDKGWRFVGNTGIVEFASLSPGDYTLLLKGENSNDVAAGNIITISFYIRPPFWITGWFISAVILFFLSLFYFFYRYRLKEVRRIERLRNKIARDLHDDVGATLSTIMLYGNSVKKKAGILKKEDMMNIVNKINVSAGKMIDEMNDIVWTINPKNDDMSRIINRMQIFASTLLASQEVILNFKVDEEIKNEKVSMDKRKNCYLIFKEVLNNAMKYSECTEICISLNKHHHNIEMKITDNGKGFKLGDHPVGNGLDNIRQRAAEIDGKLNIYPMMTGTPAETGTCVSLIFPLS